MFKAKIKLVYKQVMDEKSSSAFEKAIFNASYQEFLLKSQAYNHDGMFKTFSKIKANDGRANSLHYKLSFAVGHFIEKLNNKIPLLTDNMGDKLSFETAGFELIESNTDDISQHNVAINYETGTLNLVEVMGEYMLLTHSDTCNQQIETFVLKLQPNLAIVSYQDTVQIQLQKIVN